MEKSDFATLGVTSATLDLYSNDADTDLIQPMALSTDTPVVLGAPPGDSSVGRAISEKPSGLTLSEQQWLSPALHHAPFLQRRTSPGEWSCDTSVSGLSRGPHGPGNPPGHTAITSSSAARSSRISLLTYFSLVAAGASAAGFAFENSLIGPLAALPAFVEKYQGDQVGPDGTLVLTALHQNIIFSVPLVATIVGAVLATPMQRVLGRRGSLLFCYLSSFGPLFLELFAPTLSAFVIGRFWNGLYYGAVLAIGPLYLADLVPARMRGRAVSSMNILTIGSQVLSTLCVWATQQVHGDLNPLCYRVPLAVQCGIPAVLVLATLPLPESPVWLLSVGRVDQARNSLRRLRTSPPELLELELAELQHAAAQAQLASSVTRTSHLFRAEERERTLVSSLIFPLNQCSGIILSTTFSAVFLTQLGVAQPFSLNVASSLCQLAGALVAPWMLDRIGRRPMALYGIAILSLIDFAAGGLAFYMPPASASGSLTSSADSEAEAARRIRIATTIAALSFVFNFVWTASFYSISLLTPAEYPRADLRTRTMSYTIFNGQLTAVVTTFVVPQLTAADAAGLGAKTYLLFGAINVVVLAAGWWYLPETMGRTSREIQKLYSMKGLRKWDWAKTKVDLGDERSDSTTAVVPAAMAHAQIEHDLVSHTNGDAGLRNRQTQQQQATTPDEIHRTSSHDQPDLERHVGTAL